MAGPRTRGTNTSSTRRTSRTKQGTRTSYKKKTTKRGIAGGDTLKKAVRWAKADLKKTKEGKGPISKHVKSARKKAKGVRVKHKAYGKKNRAKLKSGASKAYSRLKRSSRKAMGR